MRTVEKTIYEFEELSPKAKDTARDWFRAGVDKNDLFGAIEDVERVADILGIEFDRRPVTLMSGETRYGSAITYSVGFVQSDHAGFDGRYSYKKGAAVAIRKYAPSDATLHAIADGLQALQKPRFYRLEARCKMTCRGTQSVEVDDAPSSVSDRLTELLRDFSDWIYTQMRNEIEYINSDDRVDESIRCNEYEFDAFGHIATGV